MINRYLKIICLVFMTSFIFAGCERQKMETGLVYQRLTDPNFTVADYASAAIEAAGGRQAWKDAQELEFDCVVTFYGRDDSFYLTEHHYEIYPLENSILVSAREPQNKFVCQLSKGQFSILKADKRKDISPVEDFYRDFSEAVLTLITAPVRFLDGSVAFTKAATPVKIIGLWYYPIKRTTSTNDERHDKPYWSEVVFYQNKESNLVDTIWFADSGRKNFLMVRGYDYTVIGKTRLADAPAKREGVLIPAKIEISRTDAQGTLLKRLAEVNFK